MTEIFASFCGKLRTFYFEDHFHIPAKSIKAAVCECEGIKLDDVFITCNGRLVGDDSFINHGFIYHVVPRMCGGKGGFGSMLRAIGAQIEKTTSREACRDLSGRRMRDVNNEKKLKDWMGKQSERAEEKERRRQERLERRKQVPNHKFDDPKYNQQKAAVAENLEDALTQGLAKAGSSGETPSAAATVTSGNRKRKLSDDSPVDKKKAAEWLGLDIDNLSDLDSSSDEDASDASVKSTHGSSSDHTSLSDDTMPSASASIEDSKTSQIADSSTEIPSNIPQKPKHGLLAALDPPKHENKQSPPRADQGHSDSAPETNDRGSAQNKGEPEGEKSIDIDDFSSREELQTLGLDRLKLALVERGLKCGGTLEERAKRVFSIKGLRNDQIDPALFAKPVKGKSSKGKKYVQD